MQYIEQMLSNAYEYNMNTSYHSYRSKSELMTTNKITVLVTLAKIIQDFLSKYTCKDIS